MRLHYNSYMLLQIMPNDVVTVLFSWPVPLSKL